MLKIDPCERENMRLKTMEGPLSFHNGNDDILNSPKRINTLQNSNVTTNYTSTTSNYTSHITNNTTSHVITELTNLQPDNLNILNNVVQEKVQWCNPSQEAKKRELANNVNNRNNQLLNINNTLAASIRNQVRHGTASSICSESSPDDSLLDYEEAHQSCSSADTSPQEEDRGFDISDSESSEDGNLSNRGTLQRRGIVNPNYPGFQHLAHTLDYSIKASSDTDFTDDDFECESLTAKLQAEANANNNNNVEDTDYQIDSVNRLDSVENIQKVFYDKPVFNIEEECGFNRSDSSSGNSNQSDEDTEIHLQQVDLNIKIEEKALPRLATHEDIVGDFSKEVEVELGKVTLDARKDIFEDPYELPKLEKAVVQELEQAVEKLQVITDLQPQAAKYNIEPNVEEPFNKLSPTIPETKHIVLEDSKVIKNAETMTMLSENAQLNLNKEPLKISFTDSMKTKLKDAFLSNGQEVLVSPLCEENKLVDSNLNVTQTKIEEDATVTKQSKMEVDDTAKKPSKMEEDVFKKPDYTRTDSNRELEEIECQIKKIKQETKHSIEEMEKFCKEDITKDYKEKEEDSTVPRKKEKVDFYVKKRRDYNQQFGSLITFPRREMGSRSRDTMNRRSVPMARDKKRTSPEVLGGFDVYNIETAMPKIDLEAIECHLRAAREEERRRRTDREEIRRRLAMGSEDDYYTDRPGRKPSLQARLQSGMNLQICFMNETVSDNESPNSDSECPMTNPKQPKTAMPKTSGFYPSYQEKVVPPPARPATLSIGQPLLQPVKEPMTETDFFTRQARLQTEARMALAQAKEMARMQMEIERQRQKKSPITEMVRHSLEKVGIPFPEEKRRLSRQILTEMNVAQLQVIVNDLHTQIETLNESLVKFLMDRDDLHMEQDSMLVDIEDLTRYLGAKEQVLKEQTLAPTRNNNTTPPSPAPSSPLSALNSTVKPHLHRIASLVKK
ncbi:general transcriptional corepressor trfA [Anoplophora glabripennis]|uniref:general transcriptional corepressor trfA n=1 Tax=Anoplophora glabripennis TaxID=217634 RepID=UPI0008759760|nr:general transcriptional corepressor trfA [Anoplophora glabripennis]